MVILRLGQLRRFQLVVRTLLEQVASPWSSMTFGHTSACSDELRVRSDTIFVRLLITVRYLRLASPLQCCTARLSDLLVPAHHRAVQEREQQTLTHLEVPEIIVVSDAVEGTFVGLDGESRREQVVAKLSGREREKHQTKRVRRL